MGPGGMGGVTMSTGGDMMLDLASKVVHLHDRADQGDRHAQAAMVAIVRGAANGDPEALLLKRSLDFVAMQRSKVPTPRGSGAPVVGGYGLPSVHRPGFGAARPGRRAPRTSYAQTANGNVAFGGVPLASEDKQALITLIDAAAASPGGGLPVSSTAPTEGSADPTAQGGAMDLQALAIRRAQLRMQQQRLQEHLAAYQTNASTWLSAASHPTFTESQ